MSADIKIDDLFFVSMKDTYFGQMNQRVTKGLKKGISKSGVGVGVGVGVGLGNGPQTVILVFGGKGG